MLEISITPHSFYLFGINIGLSVVMAWAALAVVIAVLLLLSRRIKRFEETPHGLQTLLEMAVEGVHNFAADKVGHCADFVAPMTMTMMLYVLYVCYAVASAMSVISAAIIYIKMQSHEGDVMKSFLTLLGSILFILGASIVFPAFFGYHIH